MIHTDGAPTIAHRASESLLARTGGIEDAVANDFSVKVPDAPEPTVEEALDFAAWRTIKALREEFDAKKWDDDVAGIRRVLAILEEGYRETYEAHRG